MALLLVVGLCFAQEDEAPAKPKTEFFNLELSIGVPVHWTTSPVNHLFFQNTDPDMDRTVTANTAIGISMNMNFGRVIGLVIDADVFVGTDVMGHSTSTTSYSNSLFGMNALVGPVFYLYNGSFLRVPLAVGLHVYYWSADHWDELASTAGAWIKTKDFQLGPGLYLGIQFHFNRSLYMFSRTNVAFDIFRIHSVTGYKAAAVDLTCDKFIEFGWEVKPTLGLGVKF